MPFGFRTSDTSAVLPWIQISTESRNPLQRESVEMERQVRGIRSTDTADFVVSGVTRRAPTRATRHPGGGRRLTRSGALPTMAA